MNIQHVFEQLESASDFELYRLKIAIQKVLDDPERVQQLKQRIHVGMKVMYFCPDRNTSVSCSVKQVNRSRAVVKECLSQQEWTVPFYFLNLENVETELMSTRTTGMSKAEISIGDTVGFFHQKKNQELMGRVVKLNPKRAVVNVEGFQWGVPYTMLFPILAGEAEDANQTLLLSGR